MTTIGLADEGGAGTSCHDRKGTGPCRESCKTARGEMGIEKKGLVHMSCQF